MQPYVHQTFCEFSPDFYAENCRALARMRLGQSSTADAERLFQIFVMDRLIAEDGEDEAKNNTARSAAMLLLMGAERRPVSHASLNALQAALDDAIGRLVGKCTAEGALLELQKDAAEATPDIVTALEKALSSQKKAIEREIRRWENDTFAPYKSPLIAAGCAKARLAASEIMLGRNFQAFGTLMRFFLTAHAALGEKSDIRQSSPFVTFVLTTALALTQAEKAQKEGREVAFSDFETEDLCEFFSAAAAASRFLQSVSRSEYSRAVNLVADDEELVRKSLFDDSHCVVDYIRSHPDCGIRL